MKTRFAPSPTGHLHVGGARTALFNFLLSRQKQGVFLLRAEDTDRERSDKKYLFSQLLSLIQLGIYPDEGVSLHFLESDKNKIDSKQLQEFIKHYKNFDKLDDKILSLLLKEKGINGAYYQSLRAQIYQYYIQILIDEGLAYYCFLTDEEIAEQKKKNKDKGSKQQVVSPYRDLSPDEAKKKKESGLNPCVRFKIKDFSKSYILQDLVRGEVEFSANMVGDFVLLRSNGMPVYNFCCVIDDALMGVTHVLRAEEHLSNSLRQMMLYDALSSLAKKHDFLVSFERPVFAHISLILGEDKQKLSKRHGSVSVEEYLDQGYLPESLFNFLCLLGWSHPEGKEIFSQKEAIKYFSFERLNPAPAVFDVSKLDWMNGQYIRNMTCDDLWIRLEDFFYKTSKLEDEERIFFLDFLKKNNNKKQDIVFVMKASLTVLWDAISWIRYLALFKLSTQAQEVLSWEKTKEVLTEWKLCLENKLNEGLSMISQEDFLNIQNEIKKKCSVKGKNLFMPLRVAVIGHSKGAEVKALVPLIPLKDLIQRSEQALKCCESFKVS